jgi:hypothetical protein
LTAPTRRLPPATRFRGPRGRLEGVPAWRVLRSGDLVPDADAPPRHVSDDVRLPRPHVARTSTTSWPTGPQRACARARTAARPSGSASIGEWEVASRSTTSAFFAHQPGVGVPRDALLDVLEQVVPSQLPVVGDLERRPVRRRPACSPASRRRRPGAAGAPQAAEQPHHRSCRGVSVAHRSLTRRGRPDELFPPSRPWCNASVLTIPLRSSAVQRRPARHRQPVVMSASCRAGSPGARARPRLVRQRADA